MSQTRQSQRHLLVRLEGRACHYCAGALVRDTYEGNDAVVCEECGTPRAQLW